MEAAENPTNYDDFQKEVYILIFLNHKPCQIAFRRAIASAIASVIATVCEHSSRVHDAFRMMLTGCSARCALEGTR